MKNFRREYEKGVLHRSEMHGDPLVQFALWFEQVQAAELLEPNAMTLATADQEGRPSARIVLLKEFGAEGFTFFTNYESRKGRELQGQAYASLLFYWAELERQVRVEGRVVKLTREKSEQYFQSRPYEAQVGAWASQQSQPIASRKELEEAYRLGENRHREGEVPCPPHWGGYLLQPSRFEFWQGRPGRLHDRIVYALEEGSWAMSRLGP